MHITAKYAWIDF